MRLDNLLKSRQSRLRVAAAFGTFALGAAILCGLAGADQSFSVISGLLALWAFVAGTQGPGPQSLAQLLPVIQGEVRNVWTQEATRRGIDQLHYIPPRIKIRPGLAPNGPARRFLTARAASQRWTLADLSEACAEAAYRLQVDRCIVFGQPGVGKTTIAVALTLGLLGQEGQPVRLTPLTLSLAAWDPSESCAAWMNRRLKATYPSLRAIDTTGSDDLVMALCTSRRFVLILDGLDELPCEEMVRKLAEIDDYIPRGQALCVLSRPLDGDHTLRTCLRSVGVPA